MIMNYNPLGLKESVSPSQKEGSMTSPLYSWVQLIYFQNPMTSCSYIVLAIQYLQLAQSKDSLTYH